MLNRLSYTPFDGRAPYDRGSSGADGTPPNQNNNVSNSSTASQASAYQREFDTTLVQIRNRHGALELGVIFPPGSGRTFAVRNPELLNDLRSGDPIQGVINTDGYPHVQIPGTNRAIPLSPMPDAYRAWENHCENQRNQALVNQPGHQQMQTQLLQQVRHNVTQETTQGIRIPDLLYGLRGPREEHLPIPELLNLSSPNQLDAIPSEHLVDPQQLDLTQEDASPLQTQSLQHQPEHQQTQTQLPQVQHNATQGATQGAPLGTLLPELALDLGELLPPADLLNLSLVHKRLFNFLQPLHQEIINATQLARGEATISRRGFIVRLTPENVVAPLPPAQFDNALRYTQNLPPVHQRGPLQELARQVTTQTQFDSVLHHIQGLPPDQQRGPLQELVRRATTQAQFEAVFDHLQNQGRLPQIPLPTNFAALSLAAQRAVTILSWRLSGHVLHNTQGQPLHNPPVPSTPERRNMVLNYYGALLQSIEGMAFPQRYIENASEDDIPQLLHAFGAPTGLDIAAGTAWLNGESQRGNLRVTTEIFYQLSVNYQNGIYSCLPNSTMHMWHANNYVNGRWPLHPAL